MSTPCLPGRVRLVGALGLAVLVSVVALPGDGAAQSGNVSAPISVSATVVCSCKVDTAPGVALPSSAESAAPAGGTVKVRCGSSVANYPPQPGQALAASSRKVAQPVVSAAPNDRTVSIQFQP